MKPYISYVTRTLLTETMTFTHFNRKLTLIHAVNNYLHTYSDIVITKLRKRSCFLVNWYVFRLT